MRVFIRLSLAAAALSLSMLSAAAVEAQDAKCRPCAVALERCAVNCFGREDNTEMKSCLIGCDNKAAACSCDEPATLGAEEYLARFDLIQKAVSGTKAAACHSTTPCGSYYGACTNWSSFTDCGDLFCGPVFGCGECDEWGHCEAGGPGLKQLRERYRVCLSALNEACTEYTRTSSNAGCGC
jgi:hypothetical protein